MTSLQRAVARERERENTSFGSFTMPKRKAALVTPSPKRYRDPSGRTRPSTTRTRLFTPSSRSTNRYRTVGAPKGKIRRAPRRRAYKSYTGIHSQYNENIRGFLNPLDPGAPRIMDGSTPESQTHIERRTAVRTLEANGTHYIYVNPCLLSCMVLANINDCDIFSIDEKTIQYKLVGAVDPTTQNLTTENYLQKLGEVDRWRMVSAGCRISLLNATDKNTGWFEAYRLSDIPGSENCVFTYDTVDTHMEITPKISYLQVQAADSNISLHESYITGPLKRIHEGVFSIRPLTNLHPWKFLEDVYAFEEGTRIGPLITPYKKDHYQFANKQVEDPNKIKDALWDNSFDSLLIVIHTTDGNQASLLIEFAFNIEVIYEASSSLARFHCKTVSAPAVNKRLHEVHKNNPSAGLGFKSKAQ